MNGVVIQQRFRTQPTIIIVLLGWQRESLGLHLHTKRQHDIVSRKMLAGEVIVIKMLPDAVEVARRYRQAQPQFSFGQAGKRVGQRFILLYPSAWDKPVSPGGAVGTFAQ